MLIEKGIIALRLRIVFSNEKRCLVCPHPKKFARYINLKLGFYYLRGTSQIQSASNLTNE